MYIIMKIAQLKLSFLLLLLLLSLDLLLLLLSLYLEVCTISNHIFDIFGIVCQLYLPAKESGRCDEKGLVHDTKLPASRKITDCLKIPESSPRFYNFPLYLYVNSVLIILSREYVMRRSRVILLHKPHPLM